MASFNVASLIGKPQGTRQNFTLDEELRFSGTLDLKLQNRAKGNVTFLKLPHEINVHIKNLEAEALAKCSRCLKPITLKLHIPDAEREFIIDLPARELEQGEDVFYVDREIKEINLDDMIREEITLHFPANPLCSGSCKGLCNQCGANLNEKKCSCVAPSSTVYPFRQLKL